MEANHDNCNNAGIESGLSKLKDTLSQLEENMPDVQNNQAESELEEDKKRTKEEKLKRKRELVDLDCNHILSSRLRSSSGRVYSNSIIIENTNMKPKALDTVGEDSSDPEDSVDLDSEANELEQANDPQDKEVDMGKDCLNSDCCKNTNKIVKMISKLQATVDDIQQTTKRQVRINSNRLHDIQRVEEKSRKNAEGISSLEDELNEYKFQLKLVRNVVIRQDQQIASLNRKICEIQHREMHPNLIISGILESPKENTIQKYNQFIKEELEIQELIPVHRAYRIGSGTARPMLVELRDPSLQKGKIYSQVYKLKGKTNAKGGRYFVSDHLPEELNENRRRANDLFAENRKKPENKKLKMSMSKGRLLIKDKPYTKAVTPPTPAEIFTLKEGLMDLADEIDMVKGEHEKPQKCDFVAYAAAVKDHNDITAAYTKVRMKFSDATHVVCAYRLPGKDPTSEDYADDGEFGAGRTILSVLKEKQLRNIVVFMIRYFGGQHLGPSRYDVFRKVTTSALEALNKRIQEIKADEAREEEEKKKQQQQEALNHTGWTDEEDENDNENWSSDKKEQ